MAEGMAKPELIVYLRPGEERQLAQIEARGRSYEQDIDIDYVRKIETANETHCKAARGSRVLWVDTSELDFVAHADDLARLVTVLSQPWKVGVHHVKP